MEEYVISQTSIECHVSRWISVDILFKLLNARRPFDLIENLISTSRNLQSLLNYNTILTECVDPKSYVTFIRTNYMYLLRQYLLRKKNVSYKSIYLISIPRNPNDNTRQEAFLPASREKNKFRGINWEEYDSTHQKYLEIS